MKFTFRFLRNADSGAGGGSSAPAPSAAPAASGGTPGGGAASTGDGGGSPAGGSTPAPSGDSSQSSQPSQASGEPAKIHLPNRFDPNWETEFQKLSDEDKQAYFHGDERFVEGEMDGNKDPGQDPPAPPANTQISADDPITPEIMESLPANVKALVDQALALEERVTPFEKFLTPEFQEDLRVIMEDPRVMSIVNDMKSGKDSADSWFEKSVNMDEIYKSLNDEFKIETMDFTLDPQGSSKIFQNAMAKVAQITAKNVMIHGEIKAREAREVARREGVKNATFFDLAQSVEALKSKEEINSEKHPIHGFRQEIESALHNGEISWNYFEKNGKALFAAYAAKNGMVQTPQKQFASMRERIVKQMDTQARQAAVSSTTMKPGAQGTAPNVRHGIDSAKYFSMSDFEKASIINSAIAAKNDGDGRMLYDLQMLESTGKWPG